MDDKRNTIIEEKFVRTEIIEERGQWVVYVEVGDSESSIKHRINAYHKKSLAEIAAKWIKRTAEKEKPFSYQ
ncbi:MAG: hypothetical protein AAB336_11920 [Acidobacteriota bacterium]